MAEYKSFRIEFITSLDNGSATATVYFADDETEYEDKIVYKLNLDDIDKYGGKYIDNIAEELINKAVDKLISQKKKYRSSILNIYDVV